MSPRGKKSSVTIGTHTLTWAELTVLNQLQDFLQAHTHDYVGGIPLRGIFPGDQSGPNAKRYCARRLAELGVLAACQIELLDDVVKSNSPVTGADEKGPTP
jgi:hypothetical protein